MSPHGQDNTVNAAIAITLQEMANNTIDEGIGGQQLTLAASIHHVTVTKKRTKIVLYSKHVSHTVEMELITMGSTDRSIISVNKMFNINLDDPKQFNVSNDSKAGGVTYTPAK